MDDAIVFVQMQATMDMQGCCNGGCSNASSGDVSIVATRI